MSSADGVGKPRFRKSKPGKVHVGTLYETRGWQLPCKWRVTAWRGSGASFERYERVAKTYAEAQDLAREMIQTWDGVELRMVENLFPVKV